MCTLQCVMITSLETFVRRTAVQERVKRSRASFCLGNLHTFVYLKLVQSSSPCSSIPHVVSTIKGPAHIAGI